MRQPNTWNCDGKLALHAGLGPGLPDPEPAPPCPLQEHRHRLPPGSWVAAGPVLGGLHHEYRLDRAA